MTLPLNSMAVYLFPCDRLMSQQRQQRTVHLQSELIDIYFVSHMIYIWDGYILVCNLSCINEVNYYSIWDWDHRPTFNGLWYRGQLCDTVMSVLAFLPANPCCSFMRSLPRTWYIQSASLKPQIIDYTPTVDKQLHQGKRHAVYTFIILYCLVRTNAYSTGRTTSR